MPPTMSHLKRDDGNMGFTMPPSIIVLLVLVAAGFVVCCGFAIHSAFGFGPDANKPKPMNVEQLEYINEVRVRNLEAMEREGRLVRGYGKRRTDEVIYD